MKLTAEQLEEVIEAVQEYTEYDVNVAGPEDYEIVGYVSAGVKQHLMADLEKTINAYKTNKLQDLFEMQSTLQRLIGSKIKTKEFIRLTFIGIITEACEALEEINWKPWKQPQKVNTNKFKEEIVDLWHFVINLTLASGMGSEELMIRFKNKNKINTRRQKEKY